MIPSRIFHYRDPAAAVIGLRELRRRGLTHCGILFIALDTLGEVYIAVPDDFDAINKIRIGDKLTLKPPWEGRYFHFDSIHHLPGDTVLWNGDRRLEDAGSASELAVGVAEWLKRNGAKEVFLGCTPHQPGSFWTTDERSTVVKLHACGYVDTVVTAAGILARRIGEPTLYQLDYRTLAQRGPTVGPWIPVFSSPLGNILLVERRVLNYRLALTCERGVVELDVSGLPEGVIETARLELGSGFGVIGRTDGGAFAVTAGTVEPWGLVNVSPALLVGSPNQSLLDLPRTLRSFQP